jgi:dienelactone hydrolase
MFRFLSVIGCVLLAGLAGAEPPPVRTLNSTFPFTPPTDRAGWDTRRQVLREQIQVAVGLWPLPAKTPLQPIIHGKIERPGYTIEKVVFASVPGHYVSGNLYRPTTPGPRPGVLCPHGHWTNGRFYDAGQKAAQAQITKGAETQLAAARYPLQARCVHLARLGCTVFHYDMIGYADSQAIAHGTGFTDATSELHLISDLGLQTWNSIRALDFLLSLPDVDAQRIGVTGASGGGTQTFLLGALDERPTVAFPAVMVSTAMQGGCVCENCSYLRIGAGNVDFAALFAPRPLAMTGANDWTKEIETNGFPELRQLYTLLGVPDRVQAKYLPFEHNFNQPSRELMYRWFNQHLFNRAEAFAETPFTPVPPAELSVYDAAHPRLPDELKASELRAQLIHTADAQFAALSAGEQTRVRTVALRVMLGPTPKVTSVAQADGVRLTHNDGGSTPVRVVPGQTATGPVVVWAGGPVPADVVTGSSVVLVPELGLARSVSAKYAGYTLGYNRPTPAYQARDLWATVGYAQQTHANRPVRLVGLGDAGLPVVLVRSVLGNGVERVVADVAHFEFKQVLTIDDGRLLPGGAKYGDVRGFVAHGTAPLLALRAERAGVTANERVTLGQADGVSAWLLR